MTSSPVDSSQVSLFSRAREKTNPPLKKMHGFLSLPGEIRNFVYEYYFQHGFRCEIVAQGTALKSKEAKMIRFCMGITHQDSPIYRHREHHKPEMPTTIRMSRRLGHYNRVHGIQTNWHNSLCALILVCRQLHRESLVFLYHSTTFVFAAPLRITNFLQVLPKKNISHVTKLNLHCTSYGDPRMRVHRVWQEKHLVSWARACDAASRKLINLKELEIWLHVTASPLELDLRQSWLWPLLKFRRLARSRNTKGKADNAPSSGPLQIVKVHFQSQWSKKHALTRNAIPEIANANIHLHRIFATAISKAILGCNENDAMKEFRDAWEGDYKQWQNYLGYSDMGW
ncbi:hypothetical protein K504DRAFT_466969 [Pleomassaria siparia CBS 279.74]|uniref:DUF7730 domain-containing protein n=1 Tax=Pleomassaria siparia CBS 279.74 TaxID=1314801 RepID=A0A6G1KDY4_9PLEO|nr:hypothetical protein K504DRAFT_466969 [Pleomassaria siparia CBS 279.74]